MPKDKSAQFGARLRELREQAGLTQAQLADRAGLHVQGIIKLERGEREPAWSTLVALSDALGIPCDGFRQEPAKRATPRPGRPPKHKPEEPAPKKPERKK